MGQDESQMEQRRKGTDHAVTRSSCTKMRSKDHAWLLNVVWLLKLCLTPDSESCTWGWLEMFHDPHCTQHKLVAWQDPNRRRGQYRLGGDRAIAESSDGCRATWERRRGRELSGSIWLIVHVFKKHEIYWR